MLAGKSVICRLPQLGLKISHKMPDNAARYLSTPRPRSRSRSSSTCALPRLFDRSRHLLNTNENQHSFKCVRSSQLIQCVNFKHVSVSTCRLQKSNLKGEVDFGILFDVDGVLARGSSPLEAAKKAVEKMKDSEGNLRVPVAFVTNACNRSHDKAKQISNWFDIHVTPDQVIHAPTPTKLLREFHDKHTLVIGQEHRLEIAEELGFSNLCTIDDVKEAYPLLDMVNHDNRTKIAQGYSENLNFPKVDVVLLIGEPCEWETNLQLLIDLLLTEGKPVAAPADPHNVPQIPIIACNMDLVFMAEACMPRFGHGAFLACLEALYQKITGKHMIYKSLVGKPCEITYRFAEHTVSNIAKKMGMTKPLKRLYFFGDNPNVDIMGANLYDRFIKRKDSNGNGVELPVSRIIPESDELHEQTVESCHSLLVGTGVYKHKPEEETHSSSSTSNHVYHGHRDIAHEPELTTPHKYVHDVFEGIKYIFRQEGIEAS